jgi:DNA-binding SARP family transcriptional activator
VIGDAVQVDVLGPVRVTPVQASMPAMPGKERALLAVLALNVGRSVPVAALEAAVWGDHPPRTALKSLRNLVVRLRRRLGAETITTSAHGYRLALPQEAVDATRLQRALEASAEGAREGGPVVARRRLAEAEELWRGEPLTDLADTPERQEQVERLRELWSQVREARIRADLDLGRHRQVLGELERLVVEEPLREPLWGLLMLALYRSGRQVDALRAYERLRVRLGEEWGIDPTPELQRLQWQILRQDPQLEAAPPLPPLVVPSPVTRFVGRAGQVEQVAHALGVDRLVTLHGPAGVGKSRLAVEVARAVRDRFPDGVWWVDLTVAGDRDEAVRRLAEALGVTAAPGVALAEALVAFLEHRRLLLVLDNCEHVVTPLGAIVLAVLEGAGGVRVLATSRVLLGVSGESRWKVPPLATPAAGASPEEVLASESVVLFQQRRGRQLADVAPNMLADVGRLCRTLDGMPLAIELAAAQAHVATVRELNDRLAEEVVDSARRPRRSPTTSAYRRRSTGPTPSSTRSASGCSTGCPCSPATSTPTRWKRWRPPWPIPHYLGVDGSWRGCWTRPSSKRARSMR